jgi:hypothetical protein
MGAKAGIRILGMVLIAELMLLTSGVVLAQQVTYNFMPGVNFSNFHTFRWVEIRAESIRTRS